MSFNEVRAQSCHPSARFYGAWLGIMACAASAFAACTSSVHEIPSLRTRTTRIEARAAQTRESASQYHDDELESLLRRRLAEHGHTDSVTVTIRHGVVALDGEVSHLPAKRDAEAMAAQLRGVTRVVNRVEVRPEPRLDTSIERDVRRALSVHPALAAARAHVAVSGGLVSLSGRVASHHQRTVAEEIATGVRGVKAVNGRLEIVPAQEYDDEQLRDAIRERLEQDTRVDSRNIRVRVRRGRVALTGTVPSENERRLAERISGIDGAREVNASALHIRRSPWPHEQHPTGRTTEDAILRVLTQALACNTWLHIENMALRVDSEGVATISGEVHSVSAKKAIIELASATFGVTQWIDRISVLPHPLVDDEVLEERASDILGMNPYLEDERIVLRVQDGVVILVGDVRTEVARAEADRWVAHIGGVRGIDNRLELAPR